MKEFSEFTEVEIMELQDYLSNIESSNYQVCLVVFVLKINPKAGHLDLNIGYPQENMPILKQFSY